MDLLCTKYALHSFVDLLQYYFIAVSSRNMSLPVAAGGGTIPGQPCEGVSKRSTAAKKKQQKKLFGAFNRAEKFSTVPKHLVSTTTNTNEEQNYNDVNHC